MQEKYEIFKDLAIQSRFGDTDATATNILT